MVSTRRKYEYRILKMNGLYGDEILSVTYSLSDKETEKMDKLWKRFVKDALGENKYHFTTAIL